MIAQRSPRGYLRIVRSQSGRQDSNMRPSAPKALALQFETFSQINKSGYGKLVAISEEL